MGLLRERFALSRQSLRTRMTGLGLAIGSRRNGFVADFSHLGTGQGGYNEDHEFYGYRMPI
jgi:hypothetical protein